MIVKIQKPLESNQKNPPVFVYNEDRSYKTFVEFSERLRMTIGDREKIYCEAMIEDGYLLVIREVKDQGW